MPIAHRRLPLMALAGLSLLAGLWTGLIRLGWPLPPPAATASPNHGALMVVSFLGALIGLERAVALKRLWPYGASLFAGASGIALLAGLSAHVAHVLAVAGSVVLVSIFVVLYRRQPAMSLATMGLGAVFWLVGNLLWHWGIPLYRVVPWWIGFLVITIAGERLELSRLLRLSAWIRAGFVVAAGALVSGLLVGLFAPETGVRLGGAGLVALAAWLLRYDLAWRALGQEGLPRFMALSMLSGSLWLGVGGVLWLGLADRFTAGPAYDAMLHSILLGFAFSMIFGHAPIIFPSLTGAAMPFQRAFYAHLVLLHLSLLARVGGDLAGWMPASQWSGLGNALAILLFLANNIRAVRLGRKE